MKKFIVLLSTAFCLTLVSANAYALDLYAFGYSDFTPGNNLNIGGTSYNNTDSGWFTSAGNHSGGNRNYIDGQCDSCFDVGHLYHNYFSFNLSNLTGATSATFNVFTYTVTQTETYFLYGTSLAPTDVLSSQSYSGRTDLYNALVSGPLVGSISLAPGDSSKYVAITLNSDGIAWLNQHAGIGAVLGGGNEYSAPPTVPEPGTLLLLGFGIVGLGGIRRFTKK